MECGHLQIIYVKCTFAFQMPRAVHVILCQLYMYIHTFYPIYKNSYATAYITAHIYSWNQSQAWLGKVCGRSEVFFLEPEAGLRNALILWQKEADVTIPRLELKCTHD